MSACLRTAPRVGAFLANYLPIKWVPTAPARSQVASLPSKIEWPRRCAAASLSPRIPSAAMSTAARRRAAASLSPRIPSAAMSTAAEAGSLEIERVYCLHDNYSWLLHDPSTGATAVVDPAEVAPVVEALRRRGWNLTHIINTHHHSDHVGGNLALKTRYGAKIVGPAADADRIPGIDVQMKNGDAAELGAARFVCFDTPGHTKGHVTYYFEGSKALFPGDTLFSLGCGRLFEGTPAQMWESLSKLIPLPDDTMVYCAHEYTQSNARFAVSIDGDNAALAARAAAVDAARAAGEPTVPSRLGEEKAANPFLRPDDPAIRAALGVAADASNEEAFAAIRAAKDRFRGGVNVLGLLRMAWGLGKQRVLNAFL